MTPPEMKRYKSAEWNFALDIPKRWNAFPPVSTNSPLEVLRFASREDGTHLVIIFRGPRAPGKTLQEVSDQAEQLLTGHGFGNFSRADIAIGTRPALRLDFDRPQGDGTWSCREYFLADATLQYTLGFGTTDRAGMFELYDRMARSFDFSTD